VVHALQNTSRAGTPKLLEGWMDALDATGRWALLKLLTRELRVGLSARLAKQAAAELSHDWAKTPEEQIAASDVEEVWHALAPPYGELFAWLEGRGEKPVATFAGRFRPTMLAQALDEEVDFAKLNPADYAAEWKWDGIRVQAVHEAGVRRLYSRTGDEISKSFPGRAGGAELRRRHRRGAAGDARGPRRPVRRPAAAAEPQKRRRQADPRFSRGHPRLRPAGRRAGGHPQPSLRHARARLEAFVARCDCPGVDLSPLQPFDSWEQLTTLRAEPPPDVSMVAEGLMLKRWDSTYESGRPKGPWFKWKRDPFLVDAVLMYAQRGHGKRSSFYSDYTFGVWDEGKLTPVGKAYFGFTDQELLQIDKFVRDNTVERFGPVRSVRAGKDFGLVFEVAFEGLQRSTRHRSGVAMRFPRINRIRWDKPAAEADTMDVMWALLERIETGRRPPPA
jgi:DNA ligase-1